MIVNMHEAKSTLSRLVELAQKGEEVIIARAGEAVAVLKPYKEHPKRRQPGRLKGKPYDMSLFDEADETIEKMFSGSAN